MRYYPAGVSALKVCITACLSLTMSYPLSVSAASPNYQYEYLANGSPQYTDILQYDDAILALGSPTIGTSPYLQILSGSPVELSEEIDLGLGAFTDPFYPVADTMSAADIDGDGIQDIAVVHRDNLTGSYLTIYYSNRQNVTVHLNTAAGTCTTQYSPGQTSRNNIYNPWNGPAIGDINHDGLVDITFTRACSAYSFNEKGVINPGWPLTGKVYRDVSLADIDGDTLTDVLLSSESQVQAIRGDTSLIWEKTFPGYVYEPAIGDIDGGGDNEIVVSSNGLHVYRLNGTEKFSQSYDQNTTPFGGVWLSDIDGDSLLDLVTTAGGWRLGLGIDNYLYGYKLTGSVSLMPGFPVNFSTTGFEYGIFTANLTKTATGNDIIVPDPTGLTIIDHRTGQRIYSNGGGYGYTHMLLGTTDGTNFAAIGDGSYAAIGFSVDGQAVNLADQDDSSIFMRGLNPRRTNSFDDIPLRQTGLPDQNYDGLVNVQDLSLILANWGRPGATDLNANGVTDVYDLSQLMADWTG